MTQIVFLAVIGYISGSIPFSFLIPKLKGVDIRKVGSGNVGGTNVLRYLGGIIGFLTMTLDGFKAFVPMLIASLLFGLPQDRLIIIGFFAAIGHSYSIFLKFKGGKAVACTVGTLTGLKGWFLPLFLAIWTPIVLVTKYVSLASIITVAVMNIIVFFVSGVETGLWIFALLIFTIFRHRENIRRLLKGKERKTDLIAAFKNKRDP
ncbi:glycerol-3-phosphate acyltransferase [Kosmotoga arenicorallina S304]|uniref:Glycerol-3-phosphate acyltransferase n=1 Tax=Kosmotoga arenicorallina S304 TaxID=1453497 RepID=A0A176JXP1_9BACT|nr:glycerol-3-phosphate 1-O-acyltransferase PlsY [Kosmotoga arenicorallina]OAA28470.1 glycerol-3-phosphate acyltransferase [Kosmotoga arenicorallina S304]